MRLKWVRWPDDRVALVFGALLIIAILDGRLDRLPYSEWARVVAWLLGTCLVGYGLANWFPKKLVPLFNAIGYVAGISIFVGIIAWQFGKELPAFVVEPDLQDMLDEVPVLADSDLWETVSSWVSKLVATTTATAETPTETIPASRQIVKGPRANAMTGNVVGVTDGDTLTLLVDRTQHKIRLAEIDTPEKGQVRSGVAAITANGGIVRYWGYSDQP